MKIAIVTDSTAYISKDIRQQLNIHMIPLSVIFGDESYREEIDITTPDFYKKVAETTDLPTTSQPSVGQFLALYTKLGETHDAIISIHLSSGISGTYGGAVSAGEMTENVAVTAFDSEISCMAQGLYVIEAAKMAQAGTHTPADIIARLNEMKSTLVAYFIVDDLAHLQRGGRLSNAQAVIGSLLQVKPLLHFQDKVIVPFEKIRTRKKAKNRVVELLEAATADGTAHDAVIIHANRPEEAAEWQTELAEEFPHVHFTTSYFGPVIGTHLGEGAMGLTWVKK